MELSQLEKQIAEKSLELNILEQEKLIKTTEAKNKDTMVSLKDKLKELKK